MELIEQYVTEQEGAEPVSIDDVLATAEEAGIDRSKAEYSIDKLKAKGELYEPQDGALRMT